ncbi:MAG: class I SAM-dependent methyltransferase [Acidilobaceae archaeon]
MWRTQIPKSIYARFFVSWSRVRREVLVLRDILLKFNARKVIEFGCGIGRHGYLLSKLGFDVLLTDIRDWRFGSARRMPFKIYDVLEGGNIGVFDAGYAMGLIIVFNYEQIIRALHNIGELLGKGIFIFDYNFTIYNEPREKIVRIRGREYRAIMMKEEIEPIEGGVLYKYRIDILDDKGNLVGVEDTEYPVYDKETIFKAIKEAGLKIEEIHWAKWDPIKYKYRLSKKEADSAFIAVRKTV